MKMRLSNIGGFFMKKFRNVLALMLCFLMLFSNFTFAAVQEATGTGLLSRMVRLPGEPNYHDPETGVIFDGVRYFV